MISLHLKILFEQILSETFQKTIKINHVKSLSGGCIHQSVKIDSTSGNFFIKYNHDKDYAMFETEARGLNILRNATAIHVPEVYTSGAFENLIYLIMEYVEPALPRKDYWENFGISLAALHEKSNDQYGLHFNNFIGELPQKNNFSSSWIDFFIRERLEAQVMLALDSGKIDKGIAGTFQNVFKKNPDILSIEKPALLHGDLWSGNVLINSNGQATLIDPAVYFGHREAELAFTKLFGGFESEFYEAYRECFPLEQGWEVRFDIYNLYPLMVHVNLFGGGYLQSVLNTLRLYS